MEGVGARLGRSSTRYGPATVFTGPVRKWKKKWVPLSPSNSKSNTNPNTNSNTNNPPSSHLLLYKWTPLSSSSAKDTSAKENAPAAKVNSAPPDEPPRRKYRYVPISVLEEQQQDAAGKSDDEANDADPSLQVTEADASDEKTGTEDASMEEAQAPDESQAPTEDVRETNLDLSLGLKAHDGDHKSDSKMIE